MHLCAIILPIQRSGIFPIAYVNYLTMLTPSVESILSPMVKESEKDRSGNRLLDSLTCDVLVGRDVFPNILKTIFMENLSPFWSC